MRSRIFNRVRCISGKHLGRLAVAFTMVGMAMMASAQPASTAAESATSETWMRDYVRLRIAARNLAAVQKGIPTARSTSGVSELFQPRIVGGTPALATDNQFQVALLQRNNGNNQGAQFCGGSLVGGGFVVTAAHCSDFIAANQVQVLTGTRRLDGSGTRVNVRRIVIHPQWNQQTFDHDVAVWELETAVVGMPFATLANADGAVGAELLATGWGALGEGLAGAIDLRRVMLPLVDRNNCNDVNSYNGQITDRMICAGRDQGGIDTCQGDSGGPLTTGAVLTGITSWGNGCARANLFGVYTRVSNPVIRDFIQNTIGVAQRTAVQCKVFNNGNTNPSGLSDAIYVRANSSICTPDGTAPGRCRKWFGQCRTMDTAAQPVRFKVFNNGDSNHSALSDAVYLNAPNVACVPDGTARGNCRRWFGLPQTADGRQVSCRLFDDGYTNMTGPTRAIYYRSPGKVCMPDGTAAGTCRKWFGRCEVQ